MSISQLGAVEVSVERHPQEIVKNTAPCKTLRRSWYSQTFSDDEGEDEIVPGRLPAGLSVPSLRTFRAVETNSDASTDAGSDDEGGKCSEEMDHQSREDEAPEACNEQREADPDAAMLQRRLLKKQRQREQRREERIQERATRSALRKQR